MLNESWKQFLFSFFFSLHPTFARCCPTFQQKNFKHLKEKKWLFKLIEKRFPKKISPKKENELCNQNKYYYSRILIHFVNLVFLVFQKWLTAQSRQMKHKTLFKLQVWLFPQMLKIKLNGNYPVIKNYLPCEVKQNWKDLIKWRTIFYR